MGKIKTILILIICLCATAYASLLPSVFARNNVTENNGLIAQWTFNTGDGLYQPDISGYNNFLTQSVVNYRPTVSNGALFFDGNDDSISTTNIGLLDNVSNYTISVWANVISFNYYGFGTMIGQRSANQITRGLSTVVNYADYTNTVVGLENASHAGDNNNILTNTWIHYVYTRQYTNSKTYFKLYADGILRLASTNSFGPFMSEIMNVRMGLGCDIYYGQQRQYNGFLDDIRIYTNLIDPVKIYNMGRTQ